MGGVDLCGQLVSYYNISRMSCKWTQRLIFRLIDMCIVNALVSFCTANNPLLPPPPPPLPKLFIENTKSFATTLAHQLVRKLLDRRADPDIISPQGPGRPITSTPLKIDMQELTNQASVWKTVYLLCLQEN